MRGARTAGTRGAAPPRSPTVEGKKVTVDPGEYLRPGPWLSCRRAKSYMLVSRRPAWTRPSKSPSVSRPPRRCSPPWRRGSSWRRGAGCRSGANAAGRATSASSSSMHWQCGSSSRRRRWAPPCWRPSADGACSISWACRGGWPACSASSCSTSSSMASTSCSITSRRCGGCTACITPTSTSTSPQAAHRLGTEHLPVVPGAVYIPWSNDADPVPNELCDRRAREAVGRLLPQAEKLRVPLNIENIFFNGYLMTPAETNAFVDSFKSRHVRVHFDTGNIMLFQFPEHWIPQLGRRIQNTHFKEFTKNGTDHSLESFRPLLDGTTNWPAVMEALDRVGYRGYLTFEYFHPYAHYPEALIYQTSDSLDRMLGRR